MHSLLIKRKNLVHRIESFQFIRQVFDAQSWLVRRAHCLVSWRNGDPFRVSAETNGLLAAYADVHSFEGSIHLDDTGDVLRIGDSEISYDRTTVGVTDEDKWTTFSEFREGVAQFEIEL